MPSWNNDLSANKFKNMYIQDINSTGFALDVSGDVIFRNSNFGVNIDNPVNWSPNNPYLYTCTITQYTNGELTDTIHSYFGLRKVHVENGNLYLNNVNIYSFGALDQGYWPDGIYTAPNDDGLKYDIEFSKNVGYNTLRKHVKG